MSGINIKGVSTRIYSCEGLVPDPCGSLNLKSKTLAQIRQDWQKLITAENTDADKNKISARELAAICERIEGSKSEISALIGQSKKGGVAINPKDLVDAFANAQWKEMNTEQNRKKMLEAARKFKNEQLKTDPRD